MENRNVVRKRRHERVRKRVVGSPERPRLNVYRSGKNIYVQVIDDSKHHTIASASSLDESLRSDTKGFNVEGAKAVGRLAAERALAVGVTKVVFDRGGYLYHGRIQALADAAREAGLDF